MAELVISPTSVQEGLDEFRFGTKHRFTVTQEVDAPAESLWKVLKDFTSYDEWQPMVLGQEMVSEQKTGVGAERKAFYGVGGRARVYEKVVELDEDKRYLTYLMYNTTRPVKVAYWCWSVEEIGETRSKITVNLQYTLKLGPIGLFINRFVFSKVLPKTLQTKVIPSLVSHVTSKA